MKTALLIVLGVAIFVSGHATPPDSTPPAPAKVTHNCISNLIRIEGAQGMWCLEKDKPANARPTWDDIRPYIPKELLGTNGIPVCPQGGKYSLEATVTNSPTCSIGGSDHTLP